MQTYIDFVNSLFSEDFISEYSHSNYIDKYENKNFFHMDCSGFVHWYLIQMGYRRALVELRSFLKQYDFIKTNRFFCKDFTFIHEQKNNFQYWNFLDTPTHGSILIVVFPDGNGHCMFIDKIISYDTKAMKIRVLDSTRYPHKNDTRTTDTTGIGFGEIEITNKNDGWYYDSGNPLLSTRKANIYFITPNK